MKKTCLLHIITVLCVLWACTSETRNSEKAVRTAFSEAFKALEEQNYTLYLEKADFDCHMDSVQKSFMIMALKQHDERRFLRHGKVLNVQIQEIIFESDTLCNVTYEMFFADSTKGQYFLKMIIDEDEWKIRLRN
ncbi:MAG: hypothetical protein K6E54_11215 [Bacteroidaceae bacterium]|nr:hypothetical protein [Bacteroidaceae bacterium]